MHEAPGVLFSLLSGILKQTGKGDSDMIEKDTVKLLRECDAGVKMGIQSIDEVWIRPVRPECARR